LKIEEVQAKGKQQKGKERKGKKRERIKVRA
jgi:hypothetical protein